MKKTISTILAIAGVIGFLLLIGGGIRMSMLASQSGDSVAEYYYQSMGTCMIGFSFVAAGLLWGLSWMVAAWPEYEGIVAALAHNNFHGLGNPPSRLLDESARPATMGKEVRERSATEYWAPLAGLEEIKPEQQHFYDSLTSVDPTAPASVRHLLSWLKGHVDTIVWGMGLHEGSVTAYVGRLGASAQVCTIGSNGTIQVHFESLNSSVHADSTHLRNLTQSVQTLSGTAFAEEAPFELLTVPVSIASSAEGFSNLVAVLEELIRCLRYA